MKSFYVVLPFPEYVILNIIPRQTTNKDAGLFYVFNKTASF